MKKAFIAILLLLSFQTVAMAQVSDELVLARQEFQDKKFGIFLHWGIYSMLANGEWVQQNRNINYSEYKHLAAGFYPSKFNAEDWVKVFKAAGAKYITITSRHHDGFSMFKTAQSDFNIVDATPFKRDVLKELADACEKYDMTLNFYYSHVDWGRLDYPLGRTGLGVGRPKDQQDWQSYYQFMNNQLTELLTNYGRVGAIWFDGMWDHDFDPSFDWQLPEQYALIHRLQPSCLIGNNHHLAPNDGEDIQIFEQDLPGENTAGFSANSTIGTLPLETCLTMNGVWGYDITDKRYKSDDELISNLVRAAGKNANLLLNIGPRPDGQLPVEAIQHLQGMGEWLSKYGETIYDTRNGLIAPHSWGVSTQKGDKLYIHILRQPQDNLLYLPLSPKQVKSIVLFDDGSRVSYTKTAEGITLLLPPLPHQVDNIVTITLKK